MADALVFHRLQFAFTIVYHYLFPQLTMGLALLIVIMKARGRWPVTGRCSWPGRRTARCTSAAVGSRAVSGSRWRRCGRW
jgi:cytochrome bd-type quinol oxidase subunit 1